MQPNDAAHAHEAAEAVAQADPIAPATRAQGGALAVELDPDGIAFGPLDDHGDGERRRRLPERVGRTLENGLDARGILDVDLPPALRLARDRVGREEREGALCAQQVRDAHAREHACDRVGGVGHRHAQHRGLDAVALGAEPEGCALPIVGEGALIERQLEAEGLQHALGSLGGGGRVLGRIGLAVAPEEVEDPVPARVEPCGEGRPRHRRLRRVRGREPLIMPLRPQPREVGQGAVRHPLLGQFRVHAVEADHDRAPRGRTLRDRGPSRDQQGHGTYDGSRAAARPPDRSHQHLITSPITRNRANQGNELTPAPSMRVFATAIASAPSGAAFRNGCGGHARSATGPATRARRAGCAAMHARSTEASAHRMPWSGHLGKKQADAMSRAQRPPAHAGTPDRAPWRA